MSPQARLVEDDSSYTSLQQVLEDHCAGIGIQKDDSIAFFLKRMKEVMLTEDMGSRSKVDMLNLKTEIMEEVSNKMIPDFVLSKVNYQDSEFGYLLFFVSIWLIICLHQLICG